MSNFLQIYEEKMDTRIDYLQEELKTIRTGRANPAILDKVMANAYGQPTPINQIANISVPEARLIVISPYDPSLLGEIEKGIQSADLGLNPSNDGELIRIAIPPLTEERRKELVKQVKDVGEDVKVTIRNIRREAIDEVSQEEKDGDISEDELRTREKQIQDLTDSYTDKVDELVGQKSDEIMEI